MVLAARSVRLAISQLIGLLRTKFAPSLLASRAASEPLTQASTSAR